MRGLELGYTYAGAGTWIYVPNLKFTTSFMMKENIEKKLTQIFKAVN